MHKYFTRATVRIRNLFNRPQNTGAAKGATIKMPFAANIEYCEIYGNGLYLWP